jgi:hypothetical protein
MLYMHVCSAWCALGMSATCEKAPLQKEQAHKSCCGKQESKKSTNNCEESHLAFFTITGQFFTGFSKQLPKVVPSISTASLPDFKYFLSQDPNSTVANNGFHPPPSKTGIRILIQSFQI